MAIPGSTSLKNNNKDFQVGELSRALGGVCGGQAGRRGASTSKSSSSNFGTSKTGYVPFLQIDGLEINAENDSNYCAACLQSLLPREGGGGVS